MLCWRRIQKKKKKFLNLKQRCMQERIINPSKGEKNKRERERERERESKQLILWKKYGLN